MEYTRWRWTERRERAALLVAQDRLPDHAIAREAGVSKRTLERWKTHDEFRQRVEEHRRRAREELAARGILDARNRAEELNELWNLLREVRLARAKDPIIQRGPGGHTGLIVARPVMIRMVEPGRGPDGTVTGTPRGVIVYEYALDTGYLREVRELAKQIAQEYGQWLGKGDVTVINALAAEARVEQETRVQVQVQAVHPFDYAEYERLWRAAGAAGALDDAGDDDRGGDGPAAGLA
jgi:hypothetical protein